MSLTYTDFKKLIHAPIYADHSHSYFTPDMQRSTYSMPSFGTRISEILLCMERNTKQESLHPNKLSSKNRDLFGCASLSSRRSSSSCFRIFFTTSLVDAVTLGFLRRKTGIHIANPCTSSTFVWLWCVLTLRNH